jgi:desulfoferrodoxin (superoxide reductase-like protein)
MSKKTILIFVSLVTLITSLKVYSHAPAKIDLNFDNEDKVLKVEVHHPIFSSENHYIAKIEVYLNDNLIIIQEFKNQSTKRVQKAGYFIFEAKKDDIIKVKAFCNKNGDKTSHLVVTEKE